MPRRSHAGAIFMQGGPHGLLGNRSGKAHYDHGHRRRSGGGAAGSHPRRDRRRAGPVAGLRRCHLRQPAASALYHPAGASGL